MILSHIISSHINVQKADMELIADHSVLQYEEEIVDCGGDMHTVFQFLGA